MAQHGKILIVDDVRTDRLILGRLLESLGYTVESAENGWEALQKAHDGSFDLMMLDLSMPEIDGLDVLRNLREDPVTRDLPVVVMSSTDSATLAARSLELGAEDFVPKPIEKTLLRVRLKATLERKRLRDLQASQLEQLQQLRSHLEQSNQELKEANLRLQELAYTDSLTGLPNRRSAMNTLNQMWAIAQRSGRPLSCILVDLDHFKRVNDTFGHDTGDFVLKEAAARLQSLVRGGDVVARYGGEEFLILCPDTDKQSARTMGERLRAGLSASALEYRDFKEAVTASFGVAESGPDVADKEDLVQRADLALYEAKGQGRDRVVVYHDGTAATALPHSKRGAAETPAREETSTGALHSATRLRTLVESGLMDSAPEQVFDRFTRLAAALMQTPVSLMSLVDEERQFFKSQHGLTEPWATRRGTPLSHSFCRQVVETDAPLEVSDSRRDARVKDNPAIDDLGVEAYLGVPLRTETGEVLGAFCVIDNEPRQWSARDREILADLSAALMAEVELRLSVTRERRMVAAYREAREAAESANAAKSQFLASASHELRTPLNGIIGMCELIRATPMSGEQREYVSLLRTSADSLLELVNDVLDLSKIEAGHLELRPAALDVRETLVEILKPLAVRAAQERLGLVLDVAPDVPGVVECDASRLRQILVNLVGNALKFTSHGSITVQVTKTGEGQLEFAVRDTGIGIPEDKLSSVFEAFSQVDNPNTRHIQGTGLGLAIVKRLVSAMGGQVVCTSRLGEGSCFQFTLQLKTLEPARPQPASAPILVWIPDERRCLAFEHLLQAAVAGEFLVSSKASEILERANPSCQVILHVDVEEQSALDLFARLREHGDIAVLALSRPGWEPSPAWKLRGLRGRLSWPVAPSELWEALRAPAPAPSSVPLLADGNALRVLVLEDNRVNQKVIRAMLERMGHRATVTDSGSAALELLARSHFDLALVDIQMPEMDGFEFAARVRAREAEEGGHQFLVALTAQAMGGDRERCLDAGLDAYLSKPITLTSLQTILTRLGH